MRAKLNWGRAEQWVLSEGRQRAIEKHRSGQAGASKPLPTSVWSRPGGMQLLLCLGG